MLLAWAEVDGTNMVAEDDHNTLQSVPVLVGEGKAPVKPRFISETSLGGHKKEGSKVNTGKDG